MIGVIGFGRFGELTVRNLSMDFDVSVFTRDASKQGAITAARATLTPLEQVCTRNLVVLCVPISAMEATLKEIAPLLQPGTVVMDVCSVKVLPVQWMQRLLPPHVDILATHPMFGPDSAANGLSGHKMVLCPERIAPERFKKIKQWLGNKHLTLIETTPEDHDRQISITLALTHFIGRSLSQFEAHPLEIDTEGYKRLLHILGVVTNDTWQLFEDMNRYNPYARESRHRFMEALNKVHDQLESI